MGAAKRIKQIMIERDISVKDLATLMGITQQSMSNKLYRDTFTFDETSHIAELLNCDIKFITRDSHKEF